MNFDYLFGNATEVEWGCKVWEILAIGRGGGGKTLFSTLLYDNKYDNIWGESVGINLKIFMVTISWIWKL